MIVVFDRSRPWDHTAADAQGAVEQRPVTSPEPRPRLGGGGGAVGGERLQLARRGRGRRRPAAGGRRRRGRGAASVPYVGDDASHSFGPRAAKRWRNASNRVTKPVGAGVGAQPLVEPVEPGVERGASTPGSAATTRPSCHSAAAGAGRLDVADAAEQPQDQPGIAELLGAQLVEQPGRDRSTRTSCGCGGRRGAGTST